VSEYIGVIGGSGFIGSNIVKKLESKKYKVKILDIKKPKNNSYEFGEVDITNLSQIIQETKNLDGLIHLGAVVGVDLCSSNHELVKDVNLNGVKNVAKACEINGIKRLLFSSSSEVYGDSSKIPFIENDEKLPKSEYGKTKLMAEQFLYENYSKDLKISVVRYFNVYGDEQRNDFVVKRFINQALSGEKITIYGDGNQTRCYTYVDDAVAATLLIYFNQDTSYDVFNIANPKPITVNELAQIIINKTRSESKIEYVPLDNAFSRPSSIEIYKRVPCIDKISQIFGFKATIDIEDGIDLIIKNKS